MDNISLFIVQCMPWGQNNQDTQQIGRWLLGRNKYFLAADGI